VSIKMNRFKNRISRYFFGTFLMLYSFTQTPLYHLTGLPVLVQHYQEHKRLNENQSKSISFADFLELHYFGNEANMHPEHQPLPFKLVNLNAHSIFCGDLEFIQIPQQVEPVSCPNKPVVRHDLPMGLAHGVWHPPKQA
jgi:hypothetical protein